MSNVNMHLDRRILVCVVVLMMNVSPGRSNEIATKFNIVLKTPDNATAPTELPHKSVHVKYTRQNEDERWYIVGFEPQIQEHQRAVEQLMLHLCNSIIFQRIWYDDQTVCDNGQSMLIYEWKPHSSLAPFRLSDDSGFEFPKSKTLILTVIYRKEKRIHKEQSGVVLSISTHPPRFQMGTTLIGNKQRGTRFSCRSSTIPHLLYGIKKLTYEQTSPWWRIHVIRTRHFGRKIVQSVVDSDNLSNPDQSNIELVSADIFLMSGDYLLLECDNLTQSNCYFLMYFTSKAKLRQNDDLCQNNEFPNLFKSLPPRELLSGNQTKKNTSGIDGSTISLIIGILLLVTWISIIIGCIIMRRIRGLVNFRPESSSSPESSEKSKRFAFRSRGHHDHFNQRTADADHIMQVDGEQAGGF